MEIMSDNEFTFDDAMSLRFGANPMKKKPKLQLTGKDGNAFFILGRAKDTLRKAGFTQQEIAAYEAEATSGEYDNLLAVTMKWFDVS